MGGGELISMQLLVFTRQADCSRCQVRKKQIKTLLQRPLLSVCPSVQTDSSPASHRDGGRERPQGQGVEVNRTTAKLNK